VGQKGFDFPAAQWRLSMAQQGAAPDARKLALVSLRSV